MFPHDLLKISDMKNVNIYTEQSPNPNSIKFVLDVPLVDNISFDFPDKESAKLAPLAQGLFEEFDFIQRIFIATNFITVTKNEETDWFEVNPKITAFLKEWFNAEKPILLEEIKKEVIKEDLKAHNEETETEAKIKSILNDYVRPAVESDGGAINFHSFNNGVVKVLLQGSCSGCPSSTITLKSGIENLLTRMVPEVKEVVAEGV